MHTFIKWLDQSQLNEVDTRYSVEVNFRTKIDEVLTRYAKICLGYVSAALKKLDLHVRPIFEEEPYRIMISARNWDDGEWVVVVSWQPKKRCFIISKGFFNKDRHSVSLNSEEDCDMDNAAEIAGHVKNIMHQLKDKPDRHVEKLKKVPLKRGPK
jgi:hypothetical protein